METHILTTGDIVKLKQPYRPDDFAQLKDLAWKGFDYGIVVQILSTQMLVNGESYGNHHPRNVSLNLYDASGQLMIEPTFINAGLCIPSYVDFHISELVLYKIADESGYRPVSNPPDWDRQWTQDMSILSEFME